MRRGLEVIWLYGLLAAGIATVSCGSWVASPISATTVTLSPSPLIFTLSGVITDSVAGRPTPGASLDSILPVFPTTGGPYSWPPDGLTCVPFPFDPTGHYKISGLPDWTGTVSVAVSKNGYMQQCAGHDPWRHSSYQ